MRHTIINSVAAAMLAGCGGSQPQISAPGVTPQTFAVGSNAPSIIIAGLC